MNLEYLESFYTTVIHNSISKAASVLHLSQPGLSGQLKSLENALGATLLIRSNKGVQLTEEGTVVFDYAKTLLSIQGNIKRDLVNLNSNAPKLMIGACKSVGEYALPCSLFTFKNIHEEVDMNMDVVNSGQVLKKLEDHTINIGIIQHDFDISNNNKNIKMKPILSDKLLLVGKSDESPDSITIKELKKLPLIIREEESGTRYIMEDTLNKKNISLHDLNIVYDLNSPEAIKSSIESGKGFAFLPGLIIKQELKNKTLKIIEVENLEISFSYYIASRKDYDFTSYEQDFVDFIISNKRGFC